MLMQFIRERAQTWVAWVIVGLLVLVFAVWGVNSYFEPEAVVTVAKVNDTKIGIGQFQQAYESQRARIQQQLGGRIDPALFESFGLKDQVLQRLIDEEVQVQRTIDDGYRVGDAQLARHINQIQEFQSDGRFNKELYEQVLSRMMTNPSEWEMVQRRSLLLEQPALGVIATAFATNHDVDHLLRLQQQQRDIGYFVLPLSRYTGDVQVTDEEVQAYYEQNRERYQYPEQVQVEYLELSLDELAKQVAVTEEAITALYEQQKSRFLSDERRRASHILIDLAPDADEATEKAAREKAEAVLSKVKAGEPFEKLAETYSTDTGSAKQGGDLGFFGRGVMDKAFEDAAFALAQGEVSNIVRSGFGLHIIKVTEIEAEKIKPLEEVRGELEAELRRSEAEQRFYEMQEQLASLTFEQPDTLTIASDRLGLPVQTSNWFSRVNGEGIAANPKIRSAAFTEDVLVGGNNSEPIELDRNAVVVLRVKEHKQATPKPIDEVRAEIVEALRSEKATAKLQEEARSLLKRVQEDEDPAAVAQGIGTEWKRPGFVGREDSAVDQAVVKAAFESARPEEKPVVKLLNLSGGDSALLVVYVVRDGDLAKVDAEARKVLQDSQSQARGQVAFKGLVDSWRTDAKIVTYPDRIQ